MQAQAITLPGAMAGDMACAALEALEEKECVPHSLSPSRSRRPGPRRWQISLLPQLLQTCRLQLWRCRGNVDGRKRPAATAGCQSCGTSAASCSPTCGDAWRPRPGACAGETRSPSSAGRVERWKRGCLPSRHESSLPRWGPDFAKPFSCCFFFKFKSVY